MRTPWFRHQLLNHLPSSCEYTPMFIWSQRAAKLGIGSNLNMGHGIWLRVGTDAGDIQIKRTLTTANVRDILLTIL